MQTHYLLTDAYFHLLLPVLPVQLRIVRAHSGAGQMKPWLSSQLTVNGPSVKKKKKEKERNVWSKPRSAWFSCGVCRQHPRCFTAAVSPEPGLCELLPTTRHQRRPQGCAALHGHHRSQSIVMYITGASRSSVKPALRRAGLPSLLHICPSAFHGRPARFTVMQT